MLVLDVSYLPTPSCCYCIFFLPSAQFHVIYSQLLMLFALFCLADKEIIVI